MPKTELKPTTREEREEWKNYLIRQSSYVNCFSARDALRLIADVEQQQAALRLIVEIAQNSDYTDLEVLGEDLESCEIAASEALNAD